MFDKLIIESEMKSEPLFKNWFETGRYVVFVFEGGISIVITIDKDKETVEYKLTNDEGSIVIGNENYEELDNVFLYSIIAKAVRIIRYIDGEFIEVKYI